MKHTGTKNRKLHKVRAAAHRFGILILVVLAFSLMLLGKADNIFVDAVQRHINDVVAPVMRVVSKPAAAIADAIDNVKELARIREENALLRKENDKLKQWQAVARHMEAENKQLAALLNYMPPPKAKYTSARIVAEKGSAFANAVIAYIGPNNPARKGQAVVTGDGLVGRVDLSGHIASRILLLSDINSRIPVMVESNRTRGILAGDNTATPQMVFMGMDARVSLGDRIVTSGIAGAFPPGIPVGVVSSVTDGIIRVRPFVDRNKLEYVRIVDYDLRGILNEQLHCGEENK